MSVLFYISGVLTLVALAIGIFVLLVRRGVIHPQERVQRVKRAVTRKYRQTVYGEAGAARRRGNAHSNPAYDPQKCSDVSSVFIILTDIELSSIFPYFYRLHLMFLPNLP